MTTEELTLVIERLRRQGTDDASVEVKSCAASLSSDVWESVSAFANTHGGVLILGLDEKAGFSLVPDFALDKVRHQFVLGIGDGGADNCLMVNPPQYELERVDFESGQVLVIELAEADPRLKPCYIKRKGLANGAYKRIDDEDVKLSAAEIYELENALRLSLADKSVVVGASLDDLDAELVDQLVARRQRQGAKALRGAADRSAQLARLNVTDGDGDVLLAGLLALGQYPQQFYPKLVVDVTAHPGTEKSLVGGPRFLDRVVCEGPLGDMIQDAVHATVKNLRTRSVVRGSGRQDMCEIPEEAIREAIVNAVIHREYDGYFTGQAVSVDIYADRVEVSSPGGLWGGKTLGNIADGSSRCRNAFLVKLMSFVPLPDGGGYPVEGQGSGVALMIREMEARSLAAPRFEAGVDFFKVVFERSGAEVSIAVLPVHDPVESRAGESEQRDVPSGRGSVEEAIVGVLAASSERMGAKEIAAAIGRPVASVRYYLKGMVDRGTVVPDAPAQSPKRKYSLAEPATGK